MGKKSKSQSKSAPEAPTNGGLPFLGSAPLDAGLSSLFEKSAGPVKTPTVKYVELKPRKQVKETEDVAESENEAGSEDEVMEDSASSESEAEDEKAPDTQSRKRKRGGVEDDLEASYMRRIEKEEQRAEDKRNAEHAKHQKPAVDNDDDESDASEAEAEENAESEDSDENEAAKKEPVPVHESLSGGGKASEVEKSNRTVFLGNVSTEAIKSKSAKKTLLRHLASFCSDLPETSGPHKVESIRFRSVPFASGGGIPKRASFARREILDDTTHSTNAYAVYTTIQAARKAPAALNGTIVLDRHLRVDSIAHPAEIDNKRCVFVGNLDFVDQEVTGEDENGKKMKPRKPSDIEEGLWRIFNAHTGDTKDKKAVKKNVEFVRVIRDQNTRVGKGFAYVQFYDGTSVEQALVLNEKNFPPLLPRKIRVTRARKVMKRRDDTGGKGARAGDLARKTLQGRAGKLLGRAGASKMKTEGKGGIAGNSFVFEGHRASEGGSKGLRMKVKSRGSKGKPKNRSSKRAAAYRAAGGQRP
ncbi:Nucleolar protein 12 [Penicillium brasilianum]|uniref:Nucleolar protein 12 n=1 Tax=Penicillium brasilianum TaxID=104259 RepID=A0A1S9RGA8_PENBI|nr:Nucleolar protein 12 [Penicillium brasilianum]